MPPSPLRTRQGPVQWSAKMLVRACVRARSLDCVVAGLFTGEEVRLALIRWWGRTAHAKDDSSLKAVNAPLLPADPPELSPPS